MQDKAVLGSQKFHWFLARSVVFHRCLVSYFFLWMRVFRIFRLV